MKLRLGLLLLPFRLLLEDEPLLLLEEPPPFPPLLPSRDPRASERPPLLLRPDPLFFVSLLLPPLPKFLRLLIVGGTPPKLVLGLELRLKSSRSKTTCLLWRMFGVLLNSNCPFVS